MVVGQSLNDPDEQRFCPFSMLAALSGVSRAYSTMLQTGEYLALKWFFLSCDGDRIMVALESTKIGQRR